MDRLFVETEKETSQKETATEKLPEQAIETKQPEKAAEELPEQKAVAQINAEPEAEEKQDTPIYDKYINSFENMTVADIKRQEEEKTLAEFEKEKDELIAKQYKTEEKPQEKEPEKKSAREILFGKDEKTENVQETSAEGQAEKIENTEETEKQKVSQNIIEKPNYDLIEEKKIVHLKKKEKSKPKKKVAGIVLACVLGASAIICVSNTIALEQMSQNYFQIEEQYNVNLQKYLRDIANLDSTKKSMEMVETYPDDLLPAGDLGQKSNWFDRLCNFIVGLFGG